MKLRYEARIEAPPARVFAWHTAPEAFQRLAPPWRKTTLKKHEGISEGSRAVMRVATGPLNSRWVARHENVDPPHGFTDVQVKGPFRRWRHDRKFIAEAGGTRMVEDIEVVPPRKLALIGKGSKWVKKEIDRLFAYRHRLTVADCEAHARLNPEGRKLRIAITGGSGFIGSALVPFLRAGGHEVYILTRSPHKKDPYQVEWNPSTGSVRAEPLEGCDAVIHLAGESIIGPWTESKRMAIYGSRVHGTTILSQTLARLESPPAVFISASAAGYYGDRGEELLTEESAAGETGFLAYTTRDWENATLPATEAGIRTITPRIGLVLNPAGGALGLALPLFKFGLGGTVSGRDIWLSWIALNDLIHALWHLLWSDLEGAVNLVAPTPVTLNQFSKTVGKVLRRPAPFSISERYARLLGGTSLSETALLSQKIVPVGLQESGYRFLFSDLESALRFQLGKEMPRNITVLEHEPA